MVARGLCQLFVLVSISLAACGGANSDEAAGGGAPAASPGPGGVSAQAVIIAALATQAQQGLNLSGKTLEEAVRLLADNKLQELQRALDELTVQRSQVEAQLRQMQELYTALDAEKAKLTLDKAELQRQKDLFATGLYAALVTLVAAVIAATGQFPKWRTMGLDVQIKKLEILERQRALETSGERTRRDSRAFEDDDG